MSLDRALLKLMNGVIGDTGLMNPIRAFATTHRRDRVGLISLNK